MERNSSLFQSIDLAYINLVSNGDILLKELIIQTLLDEVNEQQEALQKHCINENWTETRSPIRRLKTLYAFTGNEYLAAHLGELVQMLQDTPPSKQKVVLSLERLQVTWLKVVEELAMARDEVKMCVF
ncbi:MAG: hypothetical protein AAF738_05505 [Bacteroidota bacterium]